VETGIKVIDLLIPLAAGGTLAILATCAWASRSSPRS